MNTHDIINQAIIDAATIEVPVTVPVTTASTDSITSKFKPSSATAVTSSINSKLLSPVTSKESDQSEPAQEQQAIHTLAAISNKRDPQGNYKIERRDTLELPPLSSVLTLLSMSKDRLVRHKSESSLASLESSEPSPSFDVSSRSQSGSKKTMIIDLDDKKRKFRCTINDCDKGFPSRAHLERHQRGVHYKIKPFKCPFPGCSKTFSRNDNMTQHSRNHTSSSNLQLNSLMMSSSPLPKVNLYFRPNESN
jgi:uncharacterized Zn-finger protein